MAGLYARCGRPDRSDRDGNRRLLRAVPPGVAGPDAHRPRDSEVHSGRGLLHAPEVRQRRLYDLVRVSIVARDDDLRIADALIPLSRTPSRIIGKASPLSNQDVAR